MPQEKLLQRRRVAQQAGDAKLAQPAHHVAEMLGVDIKPDKRVVNLETMNFGEVEAGGRRLQLDRTQDRFETLRHVSDIDIISATSDEAENANGCGTTLNDIVIAANCKSIQLRAERVNTGNGRVYTITFRLRDRSGNTTTGMAKVYSPKNQGETPGDDGPQYTVTSACP